MTNIAAVDTETTGLDPSRHDVWEIAIIRPDLPLGSTTGPYDLKRSTLIHTPPDLSKADPTSLRINRFYEPPSSP